MAIITLTTDFGLKDPSVGAVKGAILSELQTASIVDISHEVSPFHITEAAYIIKNAYDSFPKGTIHIIGVDSEITPENKHIAILLDDHYFICANNGIMSLIASEIKPEKIVEINIHNAVETNFPVLDIFVKVAAHIKRGGTLEVIGKTIPEIKQIKEFEPFVNQDQNQIVGYVMYVDSYGNVVTNISRKLFESVGKGRNFAMNARAVGFNKIYESYSDAINFETPKENREEEGKKLAIFNASNYIELAIYKSNPKTHGSASTLFGLKLMDSVTIKFE
ncbi:SAM hydrolase/SAM-dependent halogenase family protein [Haloflavibacter putidus]|uniref:SAM-dependent chlorinase/fluorinase n=1 Tax=Haloflavibacter putidus TaxID=2576776 RepID=A0A507ZNT1_9FLAO|nr:SAM-dependent chlorinase/fluorinase [Haloflavibacter putidus]TQD39396.1 SAM-dependent chlorinase/fluorinase [Haloflavibacter putidus]